jgi:hypothetical protein
MIGVAKEGCTSTGAGGATRLAKYGETAGFHKEKESLLQAL